MKYLVYIVIGAIGIGVLFTVFLSNSSQDNASINKKIESAIKQDTNIEDVGLYAYDLTTKKEIVQLNSSTEFAPASLYKVPLMMSYFKLAEGKPEVAAQQFMRVTTLDENQTQFYKPKEVMPLNVPKSSDETIRYMIAYSDNIATNILYNFVGAENVKKTFEYFGLQINPDIQGQSISSKDYSNFLIALYDQTYLDPFLSNLAIDFLKQSDFKKGITQGVPDNVVVAHKFGTPMKIGNSYQLHDCGVVYSENKPYVLCVMTKGKTRESLENIMQKISSLVYEEVTKN